MHLSRAGHVTVRLSPSVQTLLQSFSLPQQRVIEKQLQDAANVLQMLRKARAVAAQAPSQQPAISAQPPAQGSLQPDRSPSDGTDANALDSSGNDRSAALPASRTGALRRLNVEQRRPRGMVPRPTPSFAQMCKSMKDGVVGSYHKTELRAYLSNVLHYSGFMGAGIRLPSLVSLAIAETRRNPGMPFAKTASFRLKPGYDFIATAEYIDSDGPVMSSSQEEPPQADAQVSEQHQCSCCKAPL